VDIRITAKASSETHADQLIASVEADVRHRLGAWVYGADGETLEEVVLRALGERGWTLAVVESGLDGELIKRLSVSSGEPGSLAGCFRGGEMIIDRPTPEKLLEITSTYRQTRQVDVCLGVAIYPELERQEVCIALVTPQGTQQFTRPYGGPPQNAPRWALHHSLDLLRKL
jgi:hypothetical protein